MVRPTTGPASRPGRPLTSYERDQVAQAVAAVRSGDPRLVRRQLRALTAWSPGRALVALATLCERYLHHLANAEVLTLTGDGDDLAALLVQLAGELPEVTRPNGETLFHALTLTMVPSSPAAQALLNEDPTGSVVALLQFAGALVAAGTRAPANLLPSPAATLAGCVAPE